MKWLYFPVFDQHIAVPHAAGELLEASRGHSMRRGVWIRPMGTDCDLFRPERRSPALQQWLRAMNGVSSPATLLLYAGRIAPEKNIDLLIEMMVRLERSSPGRFHLLVAGEGPLRGEMEHDCDRRIPGVVRCCGHVTDRRALADIYANCDIFVHPNPNEPFGIAPLEAMASGMALVGPNSGGLTSYADGSNAWLVAPDAASFASAVQAVCDNGEESSARRCQARIAAERLDWKHVIASFFELYEELHALTQGVRKEPLLAPAFYSTAGNFLGWETSR